MWNMQVRGKLAVSLAASAAKMTPEQWARLDNAPLLQAAGYDHDKILPLAIERRLRVDSV